MAGRQRFPRSDREHCSRGSSRHLEVVSRAGTPRHLTLADAGVEDGRESIHLRSPRKRNGPLISIPMRFDTKRRSTNRSRSLAEVLRSSLPGKWRFSKRSSIPRLAPWRSSHFSTLAVGPGRPTDSSCLESVASAASTSPRRCWTRRGLPCPMRRTAGTTERSCLSRTKPLMWSIAICVLHHVPMSNRFKLVNEMVRVARPQGIVAIFEHNPLNPLTRHAVNSCELDKDAILLPPTRQWRCCRMLPMSRPSFATTSILRSEDQSAGPWTALCAVCRSAASMQHGFGVRIPAVNSGCPRVGGPSLCG